MTNESLPLGDRLSTLLARELDGIDPEHLADLASAILKEVDTGSPRIETSSSPSDPMDLRVCGAFPIRMVEMEDWSSGYAQPSEPVWRLEVQSYCADFHSKQGAINFRKAFFSAVAGGKRSAEPEVAWCQPNSEGKLQPRKFVVGYSDPDMGYALFEDEASAREHFAKAENNWNCFLFGLLPRHRLETLSDLGFLTGLPFDRLVDAILIGEYLDGDPGREDEDEATFLTSIRRSYPEHVYAAELMARRVLELVAIS